MKQELRKDDASEKIVAVFPPELHAQKFASNVAKVLQQKRVSASIGREFFRLGVLRSLRDEINPVEKVTHHPLLVRAGRFKILRRRELTNTTAFLLGRILMAAPRN